MRKFDLEKAKAGAPLVTRDGKKVLHFYYGGAGFMRPIIIWIEGESAPVSLHESGHSLTEDRESYYDLFLADPPKVKKSGG